MVLHCLHIDGGAEMGLASSALQRTSNEGINSAVMPEASSARWAVCQWRLPSKQRFDRLQRRKSRQQGELALAGAYCRFDG